MDENKILQLLNDYPKIYDLYVNIRLTTGKIKFNASKSDIARLVILYQYGGFYVDIDYYCPLSFNKLYNINDQFVTVSCEYKLLKYFTFIDRIPKYGTSFMGSIPNNQLLKVVLNQLVELQDRDRIAGLLDIILKKSNYNVRLINEQYVSTQVSCKKSICHTPKSSSSFNGREIMTYIGCNFFPLLIIILLIIILIMLFK